MTWDSAQPTHTVAEALRESVRTWPERGCMIFGDDVISYRRLWARCWGAAATYRELGIGPGDVVALQLRNRPEFLYAWLGATLLGAVTAPLSVHLRGESLRHPLATVEAAALVVEDEFADRLDAVLPELTNLRHVVSPSDLSDESPDGSPALVAPADPTLILFTSGTTGPSKGCVISHNYLVTQALHAYRQKGARPGDLFWSPLPLSHGNAIVQTVLGPLMHGATGALEPRFSVSGFWPRVRELGATQVSILGSMFTMLWNQPPRPDDANNPVRVIYGAPLPADIHEPFERRFDLRYVTGYGQTEAFPMLVSSVDNPPPPGTAGRESELYEVRVFDTRDREIPDGEIGEIVGRPRRPDVAFAGYHANPAATVTKTRNLWIHTGDYGYRRPDGWFAFVDRAPDRIRRRGENISSWEVEQVLAAHHAVADAAAFAVPSELSEDDVMIAVVLADGAGVAPDELLDHAARNLPYYAVPRYVEFVDSLPVNELGKVEKRQLRERGVTAATWDSEHAGYAPAR
jgi:crotonobetaine/carnitine-CoA ligase